MPNKNPSDTLAEFLTQVRRSIRCVADAEVRGSGSKSDQPGNVTLIPRGGASGNAVPLRTSGGRLELRLGVFLEYRVREVPDRAAEDRFAVDVTRYVFELLDRDGHEIVAYHWHPMGVSPVRFPHVHFPRVPPVPLATQVFRAEPSTIAINKAHFPTGPNMLDDVIGLLIRDFGVVPRRSGWAEVLER